MPTWRDELTDNRMLDRRNARHIASFWSATSTRGMVAAAHYQATRVGAELLEEGGNAIDAAVATSLALAVVESAASGIGGMAMMVVHLGEGGRTFVLPGPCGAPRRATPELVKGSTRYGGYRAVAVPAYISVIEAALRRYGTLPLTRVIQPAIDLAESGFRLTPSQSALIEHNAAGLQKSTAAPFFLNESGRAPGAGTVFCQPKLGQTLRQLGRAGLRDFYEGDIARAIDRDMQRNNGFLRGDDLAAMPEPLEVEPVTTHFRQLQVRAAGPPAGGRTLLEMLNLFSELAGPGFEPDSPKGAELVAAVIRRARRDRRKYRLERRDSPDYASLEFAKRTAPDLRESFGEGETSHLSVMDDRGNAVSLTQSIERSFGAKVVTPELGFLHNGYMKGFKLEAKQHPHYLRPGAVARSNAAPTILLREDSAGGTRPAIAIGSTGSERMLSGIFQALIRLGLQSPFEAVHAPRLHATPESVALVEAERFAPEVLTRLEARGYTVDRADPYAFVFGGLHLVTFDGNEFTGVAEPRRDGAAAGPDRSTPTLA